MIEVRRMTSGQGRKVTAQLPKGAIVLSVTKPSAGATVLHVLADWRAERGPARTFVIVGQNESVQFQWCYIGMLTTPSGAVAYAFEVLELWSPDGQAVAE